MLDHAQRSPGPGFGRNAISRSLRATRVVVRSSMRRLLPFFGCLTLLLLMWTGGMAHAAEALGCASSPVAETSLHFEGDGDEVPADSDSPVPHHHGGCHGHHAHLVPGTTSDRVASVTEMTIAPATSRGFVGTEPDRTLRPPIA